MESFIYNIKYSAFKYNSTIDAPPPYATHFCYIVSNFDIPKKSRQKIYKQLQKNQDKTETKQTYTIFYIWKELDLWCFGY